MGASAAVRPAMRDRPARRRPRGSGCRDDAFGGRAVAISAAAVRTSSTAAFSAAAMRSSAMRSRRPPRPRHRRRRRRRGGRPRPWRLRPAIWHRSCAASRRGGRPAASPRLRWRRRWASAISARTVWRACRGWRRRPSRASRPNSTKKMTKATATQVRGLPEEVLRDASRPPQPWPRAASAAPTAASTAAVSGRRAGQTADHGAGGVAGHLAQRAQGGPRAGRSGFRLHELGFQSSLAFAARPRPRAWAWVAAPRPRPGPGRGLDARWPRSPPRGGVRLGLRRIRRFQVLGRSWRPGFPARPPPGAAPSATSEGTARRR